MLACALVGRGAEQVRELAALAEPCGVAGPFRLLEVEPDLSVWDGRRRFGGRYLYVTGLRGEDWFAPFDGSSPRRLTDPISRAFRQVSDKRLFASVDVGDDLLATLVLVGLETREEQLSITG